MSTDAITRSHAQAHPEEAAILGLVQRWWLLAVRAGLAAAFAVVLFYFGGAAQDEFLGELSVPFLFVAFGVFGFADSAVILLTSRSFPRGTLVRTSMTAQALIGLAVSGAVLSVGFLRANITWFLAIAVLQALTMGCGELFVAVQLRRHKFDEFATAATGLAMLGFAGALVLARPLELARALDWLVGYGVMVALTTSWFAVRLWVMRREG